MSRNRRNTLKRKSTVAGIDQRVEARIKGYEMAKKTAGKLASGFNEPGSRNPRKV